MSYNRKDKYYQKAKEEGFRSRAAYKLNDIQTKFQLLKNGMKVVDLGCAPGAWLQVISKIIGPQGHVIGIDLELVDPFSQPNITLLQGDMREDKAKESILSHLNSKVDVVVSDMAPHTSGIKFRDQNDSYELSYQGFLMAQKILKPGGSFVAKIFPGPELEQFRKELRQSFKQVKDFICGATRTTSTEIYLVARDFQE